MTEHPKRSRKLLPTLGLLALVALTYVARSRGWLPAGSDEAAGPPTTVVGGTTLPPPSTGTRGAAEVLLEAFQSERSGFMIEAAGVVARGLPDDQDGSRHQRFILRLENGHTVLVAHNIDLARRVPLKDGDAIELKGQYEWNAKGGVLHWTHHDPDGGHEEGWIRHREETYR